MPAPGTGAHWSPPGGAEYSAEDVQSGGEVRAAAGALRPHGEHPLARGLQRGDPQPAGADPGPGPAAIVGGPQLRAEGPSVAAVVEADLAHPGRSRGRPGDRGADPVPGAAVVAGARDRGADVGRGRAAVARGAGLAEHEPGTEAHEGHRGGLEVRRRGRGGRGRGRRRRERRRRGGRLMVMVMRGRGRVPGRAAAGRWSRADVQLGDDQPRHRGDDRDHGGRTRGGRRGPGHLAAPGPLPDQLEGPRRRGERLNLGVHPLVEAVVAVSHRCPPGPRAAGPGPGTGRP